MEAIGLVWHLATYSVIKTQIIENGRQYTLLRAKFDQIVPLS